MKIVKNPISECAEGEDKVNLFQMIFFEVGGRGICGGSVESGAILCISSVDECNTASQTRSRGSGKDLLGGKEG